MADCSWPGPQGDVPLRLGTSTLLRVAQAFVSETRNLAHFLLSEAAGMASTRQRSSAWELGARSGPWSVGAAPMRAFGTSMPPLPQWDTWGT